MVTSELPDLSVDTVKSYLSGLPRADGYSIRITPLLYYDRPHLSAWTDFEEGSITLQVPDPFYPFGEVIPYSAKRRPGSESKSFRFVWLSEGITFNEPREVIRFLYLHEWMHWFLKERLGRKSHAETACDRFALRNYQRTRVTEDHARAALARGPRTIRLPVDDPLTEPTLVPAKDVTRPAQETLFHVASN
jgi:hypothetical protein